MRSIFALIEVLNALPHIQFLFYIILQLGDQPPKLDQNVLNRLLCGKVGDLETQHFVLLRQERPMVVELLMMLHNVGRVIEGVL
jgi:hypothetical protein